MNEVQATSEPAPVPARPPVEGWLIATWWEEKQRWWIEDSTLHATRRDAMHDITFYTRGQTRVTYNHPQLIKVGEPKE